MSVSSVMEQLRTRGQAMKVREVADLLNLDPDIRFPLVSAHEMFEFQSKKSC